MGYVVLTRVFLLFTDTEAGEKAAKEEAVVENATPDYAAGLVSTQVRNRLSHVYMNTHIYTCLHTHTW